MAAISIPPREVGTYTTSRRDEEGEREKLDERPESDPSSALTMREVAGLRWFWTQAEADMGIRSTFGAQLDAALGQRISDEAASEAKAFKLLRSKLRRGWVPSRRKTRIQQRPRVTDVALEHFGISLDASDDGNYQRTRIDPAMLDAGDFSEQTIYMHAPIRPPPPDPYDNDRILVFVRRANETRERLVLLSDRHICTLYAAYGESACGEDRQALRKRFGELLGIVVALVATQRKPGDPPPRALLSAKLTDDSFVRLQKRRAAGHLRAACEAYAGTR